MDQAKRVILDLDPDAAELLPQLAGDSANQSEFISDLIRRAATVEIRLAQLATFEARLAEVEAQLAALSAPNDLSPEEETAEILAHPELTALLRSGLEDIQAGRGVSLAEVKRAAGL